ncbi:MAG: SGNH/GDSL hydrolase family protein [Candidatus Buchananbacteria bacterium]
MAKPKNIIIFLIIAAVVGLYLNRAYAYVYSKFELIAPPEEKNYMTEEKGQRMTYVAIGDSLTAGVGATSAAASLPGSLAQKIAAAAGVQVIVNNLGVPGATSFDILTGQIIDAGQMQPQMITLFIGTNDLHNFVPREKFQSNLETAVRSLQQTTQARIYLINLPYLGARDLVLPPYNWYFEWKLKEYNAIIAEVAQTAGVELIDLHSASTKPFNGDQTADSGVYSPDRFHPSDKGYALWADLIYDFIQ